MLTIVAAMEEELASVRRVLEPRQYPDVELRVIGIGRDKVERSLRGALPTPKQQRRGAEAPSELLLLGFAGGVDPALSAGELTLAGLYRRLVPQPRRTMSGWGETPDAGLMERLQAELAFRTDVRFGYTSLGHAYAVIPQRFVLKFLEPDTAMLQHARESLAEGGLTAVETDSMTVEKVVTKRGDKEELHRQYGVGTVNMEDYWVARCAAAAKVPFLSVRAVLDTADQGLPSYLARLSGRPREAAWQAATHPWDAPALARLGSQMRLAQDSLTKFALAYINRRAADIGGVPTGD